MGMVSSAAAEGNNVLSESPPIEGGEGPGEGPVPVSGMDGYDNNYAGGTGG